MAKFKVGDRARIIDGPDMMQRHWIGCEVTILRLPGWSDYKPGHYEISRPATEMGEWRAYGAPAHHLAPLTDPGADAFMERIKRLGREPVNEVKETVK